MALPKIEKKIRQTPQVGVKPYGQVHAHSTANPNSTAQNEADYMYSKDLNTGFYTHVVGNGRIIQTAQTNRGAYDVGGGWNAWGYAAVELIESHKTKAEFLRDYNIYVELLRKLAKEAGLPLKLDTGNTGIITHDYARRKQPYNGTDHVDPYPYLAKWGISKDQFKKDVENGVSGSTTAPSKPSKPAGFNINDYHTKKFAQIKLVKDDYAYKEVSLKTRVGGKVKKGTVLTVVGLEYSGKYPRFKLKSGLYITTRKDTVAEHKASGASKPAPKPAPKPSGTYKGFNPEKATFTVRTSAGIQVRKGNYGLSAPKAGILKKGQSINYDGWAHRDGYVWVHYVGNSGDHLFLPIREIGKALWGTIK